VPAALTQLQQSLQDTAMQKLRIVTLGVSGGRWAHAACFASPAGSPRHECSPYRGLRVRRWGLGLVHRSRALFIAL
jgi:hypothetical protein